MIEDFPLPYLLSIRKGASVSDWRFVDNHVVTPAKAGAQDIMVL
jgi:hypothetical protein